MVSIVTKRIKGNEYLYLVTSVRKKGRVIQKTVKYIGKKRPVTKEEFECMKMSYQEKDWILNYFNDELSYKDHEKMKKASNSYKGYLRGLDEITKEKDREKFLSIFISNSNAIEGSTMTARETFNYLFNDTVPKGHTKKELHMASNMMNAWSYVEENQKKFPKHEELFKLHEFVNRNIESEETLGKYKKSQNYVGNIYTTSHLFAEERMNSLLRWISNAFRKINDFEVAFQSHAQFEIIHPFVDGNGRVGRLLLNWLIMRKNYMPLAIPVKKKDDYISALDTTRAGKVEAICKFCFKEYINQYKFM
jgi:Fic family protein